MIFMDYMKAKRERERQVDDILSGILLGAIIALMMYVGATA